MRGKLGSYPTDLLAVPILAELAVLIELAWPGQPALALVPGLLLVLVLPGYALQAAVAPTARLGRIERAVLTAGISIAVAILAGLLLNWTPWGVQARGLALVLGAVTLAASLVALRRSEPVGEAQRPWRILGQVNRKQAVMLILAAFVVGSALSLAHIAAAGQPSQPFTQLWAVPEGTAAAPVVRLGIMNREGNDQAYGLKVLSNGQLIREWNALHISAGQVWQTDIPLAPGQAEGGFEARLYQSDAPSAVYREVRLAAVLPPG